MLEAQIKEEGLLTSQPNLDLYCANRFSACLAMNDDKVPAGKYAVSTSNRNFEGRPRFQNLTC
jgi:3-isopropylmalate/(R)-2-methylmalate dehydratase large subunit